jgi:hypothetical protein
VTGDTTIASCRAIIRDWRESPAFNFPAPYREFSRPLQHLAADPLASRLVEGVVLRIRRTDSPAAIAAWAAHFAERRGIELPREFPA